MLDFSFERNGKKASLLIRGLYRVSQKLKLENLSNRLLVEKYKSYYKKGLFKKLCSSNGIIFSCGSFKYATQDLWAQYSAVVDYADKYDIPVMFNAMNVQKYDDSDFRCRYLKDHLNKNCVKYFTSRDGQAGVDRIERDYLCQGSLKILPVADPAFWIPETYGVSKNNETDTIGINVIASDRFLMYGGSLAPQKVKEAYIELIYRLRSRNLKWQLFTNGMLDDTIFAEEILKCCKETEDKLCVPKSTAELVQLEANYMVVFGARLHSMICAYALGVPLAGFIWDEKVVHFVEMAKLEKQFLSENEITGAAMFEMLMKALQGKDSSINRDCWKLKTKETIFAFLDEIQNGM